MKDDSAALVAEKNRLEDSNNTLQQRFTQMQTQMSAVLKQKSELQEEVRRWSMVARVDDPRSRSHSLACPRAPIAPSAGDQLDSERADYQAQAKHASETISAERSAKEAARHVGVIVGRAAACAEQRASKSLSSRRTWKRSSPARNSSTDEDHDEPEEPEGQ